MKLIFKKLKIKNFMSFKESEFEFLDSNKMVRVTGINNDIGNDSNNGSGKSTLFASILYVLYGQIQNNIKNENIKNKYVGKKETMLVSIDFFVDSTHYIVERGLEKGKSSFLKILRKYQTDEEFADISKSSIAESDNFLTNEILHCSIDIFLRTILLTSDQNYNFFRLKTAAKKEFIEQLFNISIFGDMYNKIHRDILDTNKKVLERQNRLLVLNNNQIEYENRSKTFDKTISDEILKIEEEINSILNEKSEIEKNTIAIDEKYIEKLEDTINKLENTKQLLISKEREIDFSISKNTSNISNCKQQIKTYTGVIEKYSKLTDKLCDKCKDIGLKYFNNDKYQSEIDKLEKSILESSEQIKSLQDKKKLIVDKKQEIADKISKLTIDIQNKTKDSVKNKIELEKCNSRLKILNESLNNKKSSTNPFIEMAEKNNQTIIEENTELEKQYESLAYLKYAENIVSQDTLKKFIIKDLVVLLNNKLKHYLSKLGANYICVFDENMDYTFLTDGGEYEYGNFSAGERMRLTIATSFAFRDFMATRNNLSSNILILDEYIDSNIDQLAIFGILDILKNYSIIYNQQVYVISHRKEIDNTAFNKIIQIEKTNNISEIHYV